MRHSRVTRGKIPVKHASTLVDNTGAGVGTLFGHVIYAVTQQRDLAAGVQTIKVESTTENRVEVGDLIKYINICLECAPRGVEPANLPDNCAWLEWAVIWQRERNAFPTVANIGVATLGTLASHMYRENCFMTGCFPIGTRQAMSQDIKIKLPTRCCRIRIGDRMTVLCYVRTSLSTDTRIDSHRLIASSHFKVYS